MENVADIKKRSPFYPQLLIVHKKGKELILSTLIRKSKDGIWYSIHLILRMEKPSGSGCAEALLQQLIATAYTIIMFYPVTERDDVCTIQISEGERLVALMKK